VFKKTGSKYVLNTCVNIGPQKKNNPNNSTCSHRTHHTPALKTCNETSKIIMGKLMF